MKETDLGGLEHMDLEEVAKFWVDIQDEVAEDCSAAQAHLDAGRAIFYSKNGRDIVRESPDGRIENVRIAEDGTIIVI